MTPQARAALDSARRHLDGRGAERSLQEAVLDLAQLRHWFVHHCRPAQISTGEWRTPIQGDPGFPDLVLVRAPRVVFIELKSDTGRATTAQRDWLDELGRCPHIETYLFRPDDWDRIEEVLR